MTGGLFYGFVALYMISGSRILCSAIIDIERVHRLYLKMHEGELANDDDYGR